MIPDKTNRTQNDLFIARLSNQINKENPLIKLGENIDWKHIEKTFDKMYKKGDGQPPKPIRLMIGIMMLQHTFSLSDERVVLDWVENPYWQYFCGYDYLQKEAPIDASTLVRWRKRMGKEGMKKLLQYTVDYAMKNKVINKKSCQRVIVDTTVMQKNIAFPTDANLLNKARKMLVRKAKDLGITLRQSYERLGKKLTLQVSRYAHARQYKRMQASLRSLKTYLGRTVRDLQRKALSQQKVLTSSFTHLITLSQRLLVQTKSSKNKVYSLHAPEVYCVSKGKAHKKYEFGCKVSVVTTHKEGFVLTTQSLPTNPYDGHSLSSRLIPSRTIYFYSYRRSVCR